MAARRCRKATLLDLMTLPVALAFAIGLYQGLYPPVVTRSLWRIRVAHYVNWLTFLTAAAYLTWPMLYGATIAMLAIRLYGPRPSLPRLMRQPGMVACSTAFGFGASQLLVSWPIRSLMFLSPHPFGWKGGDPDRTGYLMTLSRTNQGIGYAVLVSWFLLMVGGRWRPEPGWIDRLGIAVGAGWILWSLSHTIHPHA